jgi:hypothetical protein
MVRWCTKTLQAAYTQAPPTPSLGTMHIEHRRLALASRWMATCPSSRTVSGTSPPPTCLLPVLANQMSCVLTRSCNRITGHDCYNDTQAATDVELAFSVGFNGIDTALGYGNQVGVGIGIKGYTRESVWVGTKIPSCHSGQTIAQCQEQTNKDFDTDLADLNVSCVAPHTLLHTAFLPSASAAAPHLLCICCCCPHCPHNLWCSTSPCHVLSS